MKSALGIGGLIAAALTLAAGAQAAPSAHLTHHYQRVYDRVDDRNAGPYPGGLAGRNLVEQGVKNGSKTRAALSADLRASVDTMHGWLNPAPAPSYGVSDGAQYGEQTAGYAPPASGAIGGALPSCTYENPGQPTVVNSSSGAGGVHQIIPSTWAANGGSQYAPTADQATEAQQDAVAQTILDNAGGDPSVDWVNC